MNVAATLRRVLLTSTFAGRTHAFELTLFVPNAVARPPVFVLLSTKPKRATDPTRANKTAYWPAEDVVARGRPSRDGRVGRRRAHRGRRAFARGQGGALGGAQDERIALTVANGSGCAGAAISRRPVGENVALVAAVYP